MSTPYMGLTLPTVSVTAGPLYATENNTAFTTIDSHNHTSGQGTQVPTLGININADLSFASYNATLLRTTRYVNQGSPLALASDLACLYFSGGELYANDSSGNQVKITAGGAVNVSGSGNITGMGATTATVVYTSGNQTFTFSSNTNVKAFLSVASVSIATTVASADAVTLASGTLSGGAYTLTLPTAVPSSNNALLMGSTAGVLTYRVLGSANTVLRVNSAGNANEYSTIDTANITNSAVTTAKIADLNVTKGKLAALGQQVSSSCGTFTTASTSYVAITNLTVTITTTGRPVVICLISDGNFNAGSGSFLTCGAEGGLALDRGVSTIAYYSFSSTHPSSAFYFIDTGATAGAHTYVLNGKTNNGGFLLGVSDALLFAYEL